MSTLVDFIRRHVPGYFTGRRFIANRMLLYMALRNLTSRKLRTLLTLFGIIVGIGAIFFLLSFGIGLQELVTKEVIGDQSIKSIDITSPNSKILQLNAAAANDIDNLPHVQTESRSYSFPGILQYNGGETDAIVYGIDSNYATVNAFTFSAGRNFAPADDSAAIISSIVLDNWGLKKPNEAIGKTLTLTVPLQNSGARQNELKRQFTVVGVATTTTGNEVYIPNGLFDAAGVPHYADVKIVADDVSNVQRLRSQVESQGFLTSSPIDTLDQINQVFRFFTIILAGFGAIGMVVAVLGMFNTLTISLLERTKEIGLMFALGARRGDMYRLFIFEAALLSVSGAILGIACAILLSFAVDVIMNILARSRGVTDTIQLFAYPFTLIAGIILFMMLVGFVVVLFPARRAKRINPIDALRRE